MPSRSICASACSSCSPQSQRSEWKTSPVRHSEWTRTSTFSAPSTSPLTSATCVLPVSFSRNATAVNSPYSVGSRTDGAALDELLVPAAVLDEVGDGDHLQAVPLAVRDEVGRRGPSSRPRS